MAKGLYEPIKLNQTNRYAGYQFYSRVQVDGMSETEAFHFLILSVYKWVLSRIPEEDRAAAELQVPAPEEYDAVGAETFLSYHLNIGFALDITPLMGSGIWALRIKETDSGTPDRNAVIGRFFTTRVGLRLSDKGYTELGIKIDVTDPATDVKEVDFAFRPGFVRTLASQLSVHFEQVRDLMYGVPGKIDTEEEYKRFLYMLDSEDNQLPIVVFTYSRPGEKKSVAGMNIEDFIRSDQMKSIMQFSGIGKSFPDMPGVSAASVAASVLAAPEMPYDAVKFSKSSFAYALTYVLGDKFLDKFRSRVKKEFAAGDIVLCGPRKFRGGISVVGAYGKSEAEQKKAYDAALLAAQSYSKHKAPYGFGSVVFEAEARKLEQHARVMELVNSSSLEDKDKIAQMQYEMQLLFDVIDDKDEDIRQLIDQKSAEYNRGYDDGAEKAEELKDEITDLRKDLASKQATIDHMKNSFEQVGLLSEALDEMRTVSELPVSNEDVVQYFRKVYRDRIDFTERGFSTAGKCDFKPGNLWNILYAVANGLVELFRNSAGNISEKEVQECTGYRASFGEGSMTRENADMMRQREDIYERKVISVEPHLKLRNSKGETENQRLHFWYDPEKRRIVIGYLGEHLDSVSGRRKT